MTLIKKVGNMVVRANTSISLQEVKELLDYNPLTGLLFWKISPNKKIKVGSLAGGVKKQTGYFQVRLKGVLYPSHRIIWLLFYGSWPTKQIDHINRDKKDNRIENLRECSQQENSRNVKTKGGVSRYKGVHWDSKKKIWSAGAKMNYKTIYLGYFKDEEDAAKAYDKFAVENYGEFAFLNCREGNV